MKYEDAIQVVEDACFNCDRLALCDYCAKDTIKDALNKQIPKDPYYEDIESIYGKAYKRTCSECGDTLTISEEARPFERYCRYCGKRLKGWS